MRVMRFWNARGVRAFACVEIVRTRKKSRNHAHPGSSTQARKLESKDAEYPFQEVLPGMGSTVSIVTQV
jgi:hypothetical protein